MLIAIVLILACKLLLWPFIVHIKIFLFALKKNTTCFEPNLALNGIESTSSMLVSCRTRKIFNLTLTNWYQERQILWQLYSEHCSKARQVLYSCRFLSNLFVTEKNAARKQFISDSLQHMQISPRKRKSRSNRAELNKSQLSGLQRKLASMAGKSENTSAEDAWTDSILFDWKLTTSKAFNETKTPGGTVVKLLLLKSTWEKYLNWLNLASSQLHQ